MTAMLKKIRTFHALMANFPLLIEQKLKITQVKDLSILEENLDRTYLEVADAIRSRGIHDFMKYRFLLSSLNGNDEDKIKKDVYLFTLRVAIDSGFFADCLSGDDTSWLKEKWRVIDAIKKNIEVIKTTRHKCTAINFSAAFNCFMDMHDTARALKDRGVLDSIALYLGPGEILLMKGFIAASNREGFESWPSSTPLVEDHAMRLMGKMEGLSAFLGAMILSASSLGDG
jgi:hypothetical protein